MDGIKTHFEGDGGLDKNDVLLKARKDYLLPMISVDPVSYANN